MLSLRLLSFFSIASLVIVVSVGAGTNNISEENADQWDLDVEKTSQLMLEHVIIRVNDLQQAIENFELLGFTVTPGGAHEGGISHNALIYFEDRSFIELVAFEDSFFVKAGLNSGILGFFLQKGEDHIKYRFIETIDFPEGFIDSALLSHFIKKDTQLARQRGLKTAPITHFEREKPNGKIVGWDIMSPLSSAVPFVRGPYVPEQIIGPGKMAHKNGAVGMANVKYAVTDLSASMKEYEYLLGTDALVSTVDGKSMAEFKLGDASIYLFSIDEHADLANFVQKRRDVPIQLTLLTGLTEQAGSLPIERTHGAEIILEASLAPAEQ